MIASELGLCSVNLVVGGLPLSFILSSISYLVCFAMD
jgi:hypothetical protein